MSCSHVHREGGGAVGAPHLTKSFHSDTSKRRKKMGRQKITEPSLVFSSFPFSGTPDTQVSNKGRQN